METETAKPAPILEIAWQRYAELDLAASKRTKGFYTIRRQIALLGILATFFAILTQAFFSDLENSFFPYSASIGIAVQMLFVATPVLGSILAAYATRFYSNGDWVLYRAGAEQIQKEIYLYRTVHKRNPKRSQLLERRLDNIQRQLYRNLGVENPFLDGYKGRIPPYYYPEDPNSDPGFADLTGEEYSRYRLESMLSWYKRKIPLYKEERSRMTIFILVLGAVGSVLAALGGAMSIWVALTGLIFLALVYWQGLRNLDVVIADYSNVAIELTRLSDRWRNLEPQERTEKEFHEMVLECENILVSNRTQPYDRKRN
jgi:hypothetical protein